jgi:hypothetical protein
MQELNQARPRNNPTGPTSLFTRKNFQYHEKDQHMKYLYIRETLIGRKRRTKVQKIQIKKKKKKNI